MLQWFTNLNPYVLVTLIVVFCVTVSVLIVLLIEKLSKKKGVEYHPYICYACGYDMIGCLANRQTTCPECGNETDYDVNDFLIAKSIMLGKKIPKSIKIYHLYTCVERDGNKYFAYVKSIYSDSPLSAATAGRQFYGDTTIAIPDDSFNFTKESHIVPPFLAFTSPILGLAAKTFDGKVSWASSSD